MGGLGAPELLIILAVVVVIFGGAKIPKLARSLGQAQKEFKTGLEEGSKGDAGASDAKSDTKPDAKSDESKG
jgi:sec-independent protein translocase protein TatA